MGPLGIAKGPNDEKVPGEHFGAGLKGGLAGQKKRPDEDTRGSTGGVSLSDRIRPVEATPELLSLGDYDFGLVGRSTAGSPRFTNRELRKGYRVLGKAK